MTRMYYSVSGFIPSLQLRPGVFLSLMNRRVVPFVCTDEFWVIAKVRQQAIHNVQKGDFAEIALKLYPGKILYGYVDSIAWAVGNTQLDASSDLISDTEFNPAEHYFVKIKLSHVKHKELL